MKPEYLRRLRMLLGNVSQREFALIIGTAKSTIENYEQGTVPIPKPIQLLFKFIYDYRMRFGTPESTKELIEKMKND